ncbi:MAG: pentapeptide repeat-containing protein [Bdellovibrionales bacterium]|nr:pentapeptide repeat-containing protein [Bdellovibrionales bacterium]
MATVDRPPVRVGTERFGVEGTVDPTIRERHPNAIQPDNPDFRPEQFGDLSIDLQRELAEVMNLDCDDVRGVIGKKSLNSAGHHRVVSRNLDGANFSYCDIKDTTVHDVSMNDVSFRGAYLKNFNAKGTCSGHRLSAQEAYIESCDWRKFKSLRDANLNGAYITEDSKLCGLDLRGADLRNVRIVVDGRPMTMKDLLDIFKEGEAQQKNIMGILSKVFKDVIYDETTLMDDEMKEMFGKASKKYVIDKPRSNLKTCGDFVNLASDRENPFFRDMAKPDIAKDGDDHQRMTLEFLDKKFTFVYVDPAKDKKGASRQIGVSVEGFDGHDEFMQREWLQKLSIQPDMNRRGNFSFGEFLTPEEALRLLVELKREAVRPLKNASVFTGEEKAEQEEESVIREPQNPDATLENRLRRKRRGTSIT